ncbi:MAG: DUF4241 domain-containing protein [Rhizobacter sp.]
MNRHALSSRWLAAGLVLLATVGCAPRPPAAAPSEPPREAVRAGPVFNEAFVDGFDVSVGESRYRFRTESPGQVVLTSGKLVACDPLVSCDRPFTGTVPVGSFPLQLAIAVRGDDERIALARIVFAPGPIASWKLAVTEGQDVATLKKGEFFGYGVDSGTGAFMDADALKVFEAERERGGEAFDNRLIAELDKTYRHTRSWYLHPTPNGTVAMFSSGYGDGAYATYRGYDAAGQLVAVITDFGIVPWE